MTGSQPEDLLADRLLPPPTPPVAAERNPSGWKCMPFIIGNEAFEKVASDGLTANLTVYLVKHFSMEQVAAVNVGNVFTGTVNLTPLIGAFISDAYCGRFRTLACGSVVSMLGMVALTLTSIIPQLQPPSCTDIASSQAPPPCKGPTTTQLAFLYFSMALLAAGAGGVRPCSLPFGVDQFDAASQKGKIELNSFFNWYYCTSSVGTLIGLTLVVYIQDSISWPLGFAIPTFLMLLSILVFFLGAPLYVHARPEGSVFSSFSQVFVASYKKRKLELELNPVLYDPPAKSSRRVTRLSRTDQFGFLDRAAMICAGELDSRGCSTNPWRLCSVQQVEEVKCLLRIIPIWASGIVCYLTISQQWGFAVLQSLQMDRTLGRGFHVPAGSMLSVGLVAVIMFIPIYDRLFVPAARRITGLDSGVTLLQRQGAGMVVSVLSMVIAGVVEEKRRSSAVAGAPPMSVMWLVPQLVVTGMAVALNVVGQNEFYNRQFPEHMQTLAGSLFCSSVAGASYLSSLLVAVIQRFGGSTSWLDDDINKGRLDYFYYLIAAMGVVNILYFLFCSRYYRYKGM